VVAIDRHGAPLRPHHPTGATLGERIGRLQIAHGSTPRPCVPWALPVFCGDVLQRSIVQRQIRHDLLQLAVFRFQLAQPSQLTHLQAALLGFPAVVGASADAELTTDVGDRLSGLNTLQDADDLLFAETAFPHAFPSCSSRLIFSYHLETI
jgi:hypothetical protein